MPVYALYNFDDADNIAMDSAVDNGNQFGYYINGAGHTGGQAVLDGENDLVKIMEDPAFQMGSGTLDISFTLNGDPLTATQTVLSRDSAGESEGAFRVEIQADGSVLITHESAGSSTTYQTEAGFANPGDSISLSYSWDQGGDGGALILENATTGDSFTDDVPNTLTMDMGTGDRSWIIGAGQSNSPDGTLQNIDQHFGGTVAEFKLSDTVDNTDPDDDRDGIVRGTPGDDLIDTGYTGDNDGDFVDRNDAILSGDAPNDDRILAGDGNDTVLSGRGDDSIEGGAGDDFVNSYNGDDTVYGGTGDDTVVGQNGNDIIYGGDGSDSAKGGTGDDLIDTSGGSPLPDLGYPGLYPADSDPLNDLDTVYGGDGNDTIRTGDDADLIGGGYGDDSIDGGFDDDTINGNQGNDTIVGAEGSDVIDGGYGDDLVYGGYGPGVPDSVNIPDDAGDLVPENGRDDIRGGIGNDTIYGMDDDDTIDGGQDDDFIDAGIDDDLVTGGTGNDEILGGDGNDTVDGGQGNDLIDGGAGIDSLSGGMDRDTFTVGSAANGAGDEVYGGSGGDDFDTLNLTGTGPYRLTGVVTDSDGNGIDGTVEFLDADGNVTGSLNFTNIEEVIPCFTPGTLIATPRGEVPAESLRVGDQVITRDNGIQEIRWLGQKALTWYDLAANPHLKPVLIRQGSLGNGLPERDMMVSPNHRMLVANDRTSLYFDEHEVLVSAKHLVANDGIGAVDAAGTTYIHFMCDRHEVVLSNGSWTESFQPGDYTLKGMGNAQRAEIYDLFPELKTEAGRDSYQAARRVLKRHEAMLLVK